MLQTLTIEATVDAENSLSETPGTLKPSEKYEVLGGTVIVTDKDGSLDEATSHDKIEVIWKHESNTVDITDKPMNVFALKKLLESVNFVPFFIDNGKNHTLTAKHTSAGNGAVSAVPITVQILLQVIIV